VADEQDAVDRDIERVIQPVHVKHLWAYLEATKDADLNIDLSELATYFIL
jgi:hypothetical protein